jgi:hypothetical protein
MSFTLCPITIFLALTTNSEKCFSHDIDAPCVRTVIDWREFHFIILVGIYYEPGFLKAGFQAIYLYLKGINFIHLALKY